MVTPKKDAGKAVNLEILRNTAAIASWNPGTTIFLVSLWTKNLRPLAPQPTPLSAGLLKEISQGGSGWAWNMRRQKVSWPTNNVWMQPLNISWKHHWDKKTWLRQFKSLWCGMVLNIDSTYKISSVWQICSFMETNKPYSILTYQTRVWTHASAGHPQTQTTQPWDWNVGINRGYTGYKIGANHSFS